MLKDNKYVILTDRTDRLGANITNYVATICYAIKKEYYIILIKNAKDYNYSDSVFIKYLFEFIEIYNRHLMNYISIDDCKHDSIPECYIHKMLNTLYTIECDFITFFKEHIFNEKIFNKLCMDKNYYIPDNFEKTILVHLRLDDVANNFIYDATDISNTYRNMINNNESIYIIPSQIGQSPIDETLITEQIEQIKKIYNDYEVIIITSPNSKHTLPYKSIQSLDENYDLFLLSKCKILIGSRSSFSFSALLFGNHLRIYYPLWETCIAYGLTTKYDKTTNIITF
jgi:hypothetical protein